MRRGGARSWAAAASWAAAIGSLSFAAPAADPALVAGCATQPPPGSWTLAEIERESPAFVAGEPPLLLAWQVLEDERPLRIESALVGWRRIAAGVCEGNWLAGTGEEPARFFVAEERR